MQSEHLAKLRVRAALDHVVGGVPFAPSLFGHFDEGEELARPHRLAGRSPRLAKALVDILLAPVPQGELPQELLPFRAPHRIVGKPLHCGIGVLCLG